MKALLLTSLLAGTSLLSQAQTYYLNLSGQQLSVPGRTVVVEQVLDGRGQPAAIGFVYKGMGSKPAAVLFKQGMETELTALVRQLPARPTDHPVVLCLRQLRVGEEIGNFGEEARADLAADVYAHLPDGYHFVQSVGAHTSERSVDVTHTHARHLTELLSFCLSKLATADWTAAAARPALALGRLATDVPPAPAAATRRSLPILREAPRRGLYQNLGQFLANQPDTTLPFRVDTVRHRYRSEWAAQRWKGVAQVRPQPEKKGREGKLPDGLWGFCDGRQVFVQYQERYFPLMRQGSFFTFVGEAPLDVAYATQAQANAYRGPAMAPTSTMSIRVPDHTSEPAAYALDMRTGELAPYPGLTPLTRTDTAYVYVYRPSFPAGSAAVRVLLNGHEAGSLRPGEYLELPWPYFARPLQLCVAGSPGVEACQYLVPNTSRPSYLRLTPGAAAGLWQWVPAAQGNADLDALDKLAKPRP